MIAGGSGRWIGASARVVGVILGALLWLWASLAVFHCLPGGPALRWALALPFALAGPLAFHLLPSRRAASVGVLAAVVLVMLYLSSLEPSNDRDWAPEQALLPSAELVGGKVTVRNVRNRLPGGRGEASILHEDRAYRLEDLRTLHFVMARFSSWDGVAHVFLTFGFEGGEALAVSVEARREKGEDYSPLAGLFRRYELMYVIGDERDLIGSRLAAGEGPVCLYPIRARPEDIRALFIAMVERANRLAAQPEFYHSVWSTCATNVLRHVNQVLLRQVPWSRKVLFPGRSDRLAWELGLIDTDLPFEEARRRFEIDRRDGLLEGSRDFSRAIREGR